MYNRTKKNKDMNNNIIKSLRRTLLCTVAAAAVSIGFTACADETFTTQNANVPANGYKLSISANMGGGETRTIAYNETANRYDATFEMTEKIFVIDVTQNAVGVKKDEWGGYSNTYLYPDANGQKANLVGELTFTQYDRQTGEYGEEIVPQKDDELILFYNNDNYVFRYNHNENDYYLNNSGDYALATVKITSAEGGVIKTEPAYFENQQSVYKINFSGVDAGVKFKKIDIQSEKNNLVTNYFAFRKDNSEEFGVVNYTYEGEGADPSELTFMLRYSDNPDGYSENSTSGEVFTFTALGSNGHNYLGQKEVTTELKNGVYYQANIEMTDLGEAMKVRNTTTEETLYFSSYCSIFTNDADYIAEYNGYDTCIEWFGGKDDKHTLTIKDLTMYNSKDCAIAVRTHYDDPENTKVHKLVLDGKNTLSVTGYQSSLSVQINCSLIISSASTGTGKLILKSSDGEGLAVSDNAKVTIESGEVTVDGGFGIGTNSSCVITNSGKLRVLTQKNNSSEGIKAGSGYVLQTATEGDYTVYTVKDAPEPKAPSEVTTADLGSIIGSDGKVYVPNCVLPEGVSPVGVITHISSTGHGLAIGSEPIIIKKELENGRVEPFQYFSWDNSAEANDGKTATKIFDDWNATNSVSFGTWRFATVADWQQMILSCRIDGDATKVSEEMVAEGLVTQLKQAGTYKDYLDCWTGEPNEEESGRWTSINFDYGNWDEVKQSYIGPYKLIISRWNEPGYSHNIIPVLEF